MTGIPEGEMLNSDPNKLYNISFFEEGKSEGPSIKEQVKKEFEMREQQMKLEDAMNLTTEDQTMTVEEQPKQEEKEKPKQLNFIDKFWKDQKEINDKNVEYWNQQTHIKREELER